ncbi:MAG TPA: phosphatase PAP2 family protein [Terriglobia bacterium]|nr:phosphatase PAP2 family protein [Terriglobia bacterium]
MNWFDLWTIHLINFFSHHWWITDAIIVQIANNDFIDGGILMALFWWAWIEHGKENPEKREILAVNLFVTAFAVIVARLLALSLPYRDRPFSNPLLHFQVPYTSNPEKLIHWSSFPSDHAVLTFCVVAGLWMVSRRLGMLAAAYGLLTNLARVYSGAHYSTDVAAGLVLGVGMAFLCRISSLKKVARTALNILDQQPAYLYALLFACTFEIAEMFDSLRHITVFGARATMLLSPGAVVAAAIPLLAMLLGMLAWLRLRSRKKQAMIDEFSSTQAR